MPDRAFWRLGDMKNAIPDIRNLLSGKSIESLSSDNVTRAAYERFLEVLSEASRHVPESSKAEFSQIEWRRIADLGNVIRHIYHRIDLGILWNIYEKDLDSLERVVDILIARFDRSGDDKAE
jgi:uncharacterized protein with HEPN domain